MTDTGTDNDTDNDTDKNTGNETGNDEPAAGPLTSGELTRRRVEAIVYGPMDDALRNHLTTLAYVDMSNAMAELLGHDDANWYAFTVWPSFTVGQVIRGGQAARIRKQIARLPLPAGWRDRLTDRVEARHRGRSPVLQRCLAAGNRGLFWETGNACADFVTTFAGRDPDTADHAEEWERFEAFGERVLALPNPPGRVWPDGRREQLRDGFRAFLEAMQTDDPRRRSQLIFLGNIRIGDHEQRRAQGWLDLSMIDPIRRMTRRFDDTTTRNRGIALSERLWTRFLTKQLMVIDFPGESLGLGAPVPPHPTSDGRVFPSPLDDLDDDVRAEFDEFDRAAPGGDGAERWNDLASRMAFIVTIFRSRQRAGLVGIDPYTADERARIMALAAELDALDRRYEFEGPLLFADMTKELESPWPDDVTRDFTASLTAARERGDDEADAAIEAFYRPSGRAPEDRFYTDVMVAISRPDSDLNTGPLSEFLGADPVLPEWADMAEIERAQAWFQDMRTAAHVGLFFGSMPLSYAASKGCQPLGLVSTLNGDTERRLWESARFLEDVFTTPFWEPGTEGYQTIRGVRLFHASVRHTIDCESRHIVDRPLELGGRAWNPEWGRPINQEDLMAGAFDFGIGAIHTMDRFGVAIADADARAYLHTWLVVGAMLGVEPELLTSPVDPARAMTLEEAQYTARLILFRQLGPTAAGRRLMDGLLSLMDDWFPGPLSRLPRSLMYVALDDELATVLGMSPPGRSERLMSGITSRGRSWRQDAAYSRGYQRLVTKVGDYWLDWWERDYGEVPPYRRGGVEQVRARMPLSVQLTIQSLGDIEDVAVDLSDLDGVSVSSHPVDDEGYEGLGLTTVVDLSADVAGGLRSALKRVRDTVQAASNIRRAEVVIDGRVVPVGQLTDAEIDSLFPD